MRKKFKWKEGFLHERNDYRRIIKRNRRKTLVILNYYSSVFLEAFAFLGAFSSVTLVSTTFLEVSAPL